MIYLPDANALSTYMRGDDSRLVQRMQAAFAEIRLSVIVLAEREFGVTKGTNASARLQSAGLAQDLPIEPLTREDCTHYAAIRHDLEAPGTGYRTYGYPHCCASPAAGSDSRDPQFAGVRTRSWPQGRELAELTAQTTLAQSTFRYRLSRQLE
jgi:predicted nucleic acid-binding protein